MARITSDDSAPSRRDPMIPIGTEVGEAFVIHELIGHGGMAQVFRAEQIALGRDVALKVMRPGTVRDQARLLREAESLARLTHPNSVAAHDIGHFEHDEMTWWFIAMELVRGQTLKVALEKDGTVEVPRALDIADAIARSLRDAHSHGIVHRDLKPSNIMLPSDPEAPAARVLDYGIAHVIDAETLTNEGELVGSPRYMAPEQFKQDNVDARADIYALGVLLYKMLTGKHPIGKTFSLGDVLRSLESPPPDISGEGFSKPVAQLVARCLARKPADRFQSMDEVITAIAASRPTARIRPWKQALALLTMLMLAAGVAFAIHLRSHFPEPDFVGGGETDPPVALFVPRRGLFWDAAREFFVAAAEDIDRRVVVYDAVNQPETMERQARSFTRSVGGPIILQNFEGVGDRMVERAVESGSVIVRINNDFLDATNVAHLRPDDEATGFALAEDLIDAARALTDGSPVRLLVVRGRAAASAQIARGDGLDRALRAHPDVEVVAMVDGDWERDRARVVVTDAIDDATAIWAANDDMALGAIEGAIRAGREPGRDVLIGGIDWSRDALAAIEAGSMYVSYGGHFMEAGWALLLIEAGHSRDTIVRTPMRPVTRQNVGRLLGQLRPGAFQRIDFRAVVSELREGDTDCLDPAHVLAL